jgi:hypothetical protein
VKNAFTGRFRFGQVPSLRRSGHQRATASECRSSVVPKMAEAALLTYCLIVGGVAGATRFGESRKEDLGRT